MCGRWALAALGTLQAGPRRAHSDTVDVVQAGVSGRKVRVGRTLRCPIEDTPLEKRDRWVSVYLRPSTHDVVILPYILPSQSEPAEAVTAKVNTRAKTANPDSLILIPSITGVNISFCYRYVIPDRMVSPGIDKKRETEPYPTFISFCFSAEGTPFSSHPLCA